MALNSFLLSFLLHLGGLLPVAAEQSVYSLEGDPVTLSCPDVFPNQNQGTGFWKYNGVEVLKYTNGKPWKVRQEHKFKGTEKGDFSLQMPEAKEGLYTCDVSGKEKSIRLHILKGFLEDLDDEIFAAINSTVTLSYKLNPPGEKYPNTMEVLLTKEVSGKSTSLGSGRDSCSPKTIPKVQFEDGGRYQCRLRFSRGWLNKTIHLVVMKVSASPPGPLPKEDAVKLCCSISAPLPPGAVLRWDAVNISRDVPHCLTIQKAGQQTCSLIVGKEEKISVNYTVEEATEQTGFPLPGLALGVGVPLLLLILLSVCLFTYIAVKRKKRRMERMAQAKQHLLAKRTCQCQRDQSNDYYHT
ncbi:PREDICTED: uncharacterized protein LOC107108191 [Gekko japonicus]|uniref:Uncharacterized protein LOC107108191 n=1 Tax=Gekko japonicus TaxID=146911 RepID=A0ABM1JRJ4_GEKJA|nr:PREDICTED: uncharacterized protein LOC107108191 [Gekko japonicus]